MSFKIRKFQFYPFSCRFPPLFSMADRWRYAYDACMNILYLSYLTPAVHHRCHATRSLLKWLFEIDIPNSQEIITCTYKWSETHKRRRTIRTKAVASTSERSFKHPHWMTPVHRCFTTVSYLIVEYNATQHNNSNKKRNFFFFIISYYISIRHQSDSFILLRQQQQQ